MRALARGASMNVGAHTHTLRHVNASACEPVRDSIRPEKTAF
jgi:hypothetical protein